MKRIVRLTESDLVRIVKRVIRESEDEVYDDNDDLIGHYDVGPDRLDSARFIPNQKGTEKGHSMGPNTPERSYKKPKSNGGRLRMDIPSPKMSRPNIPSRRYDDLEEQHYITNNSDFSYPEDPNEFNKFHIEDMFEVVSSVKEANDLIEEYYPGYYFDITFETDYGKTMSFFSPEGKEIVSKYIVGCCGGSGNLENLDRFKRSDDAIYNPRKRY